MHHPSCSSEAPAAALLPAAAVKDDAVVVNLKKGKNEPADRCRGEEAAVVTEAAVDVCLAAAAMAGAALLAWWAVAFHPSYAHLWMVPLGLVLAGTPPVVCLALRFSGGGSRVPPAKGKGSAAGAPTMPLAAVVVEK
ncbi:hypothetical protein BAE44_0018849 [Dichanthelium oligosanthes]|uniref:Uncharacterized protein n=1 Tax=Dichanthelium oligosanthes TaxID=888268 RepID=A0A1E5V4Q2_9POAL|nr:hypothetical protein BAE44_0018849 [Dichanthelium oligosanthes]